MEQEWDDINKISQGTIVLVFTINKKGEKNPILDKERKPIQIKILAGGILMMIHSDGETKTRINNYSILEGVKKFAFTPLKTTANQ